MGFLFGQPAVEQKPKVKPPMTQREQNIKWMMLAPHIKKHFKTDMSEQEIAAELSYQAYLKESSKKKISIEKYLKAKK